MVFSCVNCRARYRIDPQLVAARTVKFVCRKCGQAHLLRDPAQFPECVVATGSPTTPDGATPVKETGSPGNGGAALGNDSTAPGGWLVMIGGRRIGPMTVEDIRRRHAAGELDGRTLAWRPTLPQWQRLQDLGLGLDAPDTGSIRDPVSRNHTSRPAPGTPALADKLFGDLSTPSIDLRRAAEVQPEEPLWHSRAGRRPLSQADLPPDLPAPAAPKPPATGPSAILAPVWPAPPGPGRPESSSSASEVPEPAGRPTATFRPPDVHDFGAMLQGIQRRERRRRVGRVAAIVAAAIVLLGGAATGAALWLGRDSRPAEVPAMGKDPVRAPSSRPVTPDPLVVTPPSPPLPAASPPAPAAVRPPTSETAPPVAVSATVRTAKPVVSSSALGAEMEAFLKRRHPDFVACRAQLNPATDATVNLQIDFFVDVSGAVEDIRVESMDRQAVMPLIDCVRGIVSEGRFSPRTDRTPFHSVLVL